MIELREHILTQNFSDKELIENELLIENASEKLAEMIKEGTVNEGFFGSVLGGITGITIGATVMKAVCKSLGITSGVLYNLLTSKAVCAAAGAALGARV